MTGFAVPSRQCMIPSIPDDIRASCRGKACETIALLIDHVEELTNAAQNMNSGIDNLAGQVLGTRAELSDLKLEFVRFGMTLTNVAATLADVPRNSEAVAHRAALKSIPEALAELEKDKIVESVKRRNSWIKGLQGTTIKVLVDKAVTLLLGGAAIEAIRWLSLHHI